MNTTPNNTHAESSLNAINYNKPAQTTIIGAADKPEDKIIMHDARIITPHPYGVYGLCKIIEHLQNN